MKAFNYGTHSVRVLVGAGVATQLAPELDRIGVTRALVISTIGRSSVASTIANSLGGAAVGQFTGARRHVPTEVVAAALDTVRSSGADVCIAVGGGSATGLAKAVALETGLPIVAVPTTYSGSEMTSIWGVTDAGVKKTGRDDRVAPRIVACDPLMTLDLPADTSAQSGMNAIAHAVEALYAPDANPVASLFARDSIRLLANSLRRIVRHPRDASARMDALVGSHLAGRALDMVSMGLHHRLCHVIGGLFDTPHALTHAILLPHVVAFTAGNEGKTGPRSPSATANDEETGKWTEGATVIDEKTGKWTGGATVIDDPNGMWTQIRIAIDGVAGGRGAQPAPGRAHPHDGPGGDRVGEGMEAAHSIHRLNQQLGITATLKTLGLSQPDLDQVVDGMAASSGLVETQTGDAVRALLERAWLGVGPGSPVD